VCGDETGVPATTAIVDCDLAHAEIIRMQGKSYRLHQHAQQGQSLRGVEVNYRKGEECGY
jgi:hypothetical protein